MDKKQQIISLFEEVEKKFTGGILVKGAFYSHNGYYLPIKVLFTVDSKKEESKPNKLEYGNLILIEDLIERNVFKAFLNALESAIEFNLLSYPLKLKSGYLADSNENSSELTKKHGFYTSLNDYERILLKETRSFPNSTLRSKPTKFFIYKYQPDSEWQYSHSQMRFDSLPVKIELPAFPDYYSALNFWLGKEFANISDWSILFSFPLSDTMIKSVKYDSGKFNINFSINDPKNDLLQCKYYIEYEADESQTGDLNISHSETINVKKNVRRLFIVLYDKRNPERIIDYRDYNWNDPYGAIRELEFDIENLEYLLLKGENSQLEFKLNIDKSDPKEFLETVCSFSNSDGGLILFGVGNNGNVKGLDEKEIMTYKKRIEDLISYHIEPFVICEIKEIDYKDRKILMLKVPKGMDYPYNYKSKGFYIRAFSTDRLATRDEVLSLIKRRELFYR